MRNPEELPKVTEQTLYGLVADDSLKYRILQKAADPSGQSGRKAFRTVSVLCTALAVLLAAVLSLNTLQAVPSGGPGEINVFAAGGTGSGVSVLMPEEFDPDCVISITMDGIGTTTDQQQCARLAAILKNQSNPAGTAAESEGNRLQILTEDGTAYSFGVSEPYLTGNDGQCWNCKDFFTEFRNAVR